MAKKQTRSGNVPELKGMEDTIDGVGKAARKYLEAIEAHEGTGKHRGETEANLIRALRKAKRTSIQIEGWKFNHNHTGPKDSIKVQKPK